MKMHAQKLFAALALLVLSTLNPQLSTCLAQGTAFAYQGHLNDGGTPANGNYDLTFTLFATNTGGAAIAGPLTNSATAVSNGLFGVTLDFGPGVFTGNSYWLEVAVRTNGGGSFTELVPRQPLLPVPYAIMANSASNLLGALPAVQLSGALPATQLSGTLAMAQLPGTVVTNNQNGVNLSGTFSGDGSGLADIPLASLQSGGAGSAQVLTWNGSAWVPASALSANNAAVLGTMTATFPMPAFTSLYSFSNLDGANPHAGLILGQDGNFYGSTAAGGTNNQGTIFKFTINGVLTTLYTAIGGSSPYEPGPMIQENDGNFYGTIDDYPTYNGNVVFRLTPNGAFSIFATPNGANPIQNYILHAADGYLYGLSEEGGTNLYVKNQYSQTVGCGSLYRINTNGTVEILFSFDGTNGNCTSGPLIQGADGGIYGTTGCGGIGFAPFGYKSAFPDGTGSGYGTIFRWNTDGTLTTLVDFNGTNGCDPQNCGMVQAGDGSLYGMTEYGGIGFNAANPGYLNGYGTIFRLTGSTLTTLYQFTGGNDGADPQGSLLQAKDGNFYGVTHMGGSNNVGTIFRITPSGAFTTLFSFTGTNGATPTAQTLVAGVDGNLYGMTSAGGTSNLGTIFQLTFPSPLLNISTAVTATGFYGNGSGLTNVNPMNLGAGTAGINITGNAATATSATSATTASNVTGNIADSQLSANIARLNGTNTFTGTNVFLGVTIATNANNLLNGTFAGNGSGLTNLNLLSAGQPVYINFDSVDASGGIVDATAYLSSFGITLANVSPAGSVFIVNDTNYYGGGAVYASSPHNFLLQNVGGSPNGITYTLVFNTPLQSVTFTRCALGSNAATPGWTATAYAGANVIETVGVGLGCVNCDLGHPAQVYTINGPGITSLTITADGYNFTAISSVPLDDFYLVPQVLNVNGAITAANFTGNGSGLTGLNPTNLSVGTAGINITGNAATATSATSATTATTANNFSGTLSGDVTGSQSATVVSTVGGVSAANMASGASAANAATSANTPGAIVQRDGSGNFSAGTITANLAGNAATATTASNVIAGIVITNAFITNSAFAGNGGGLTNLSPARLQSGGATGGQILTWNGSAWSPSNAPVGGGSGLATFSGSGTNENFYGVTYITNITALANQTIFLEPGNVNPNGNSGNGGNVSIIAGNAGAVTGGSGGNLTLQAGNATPMGGSGYNNQGSAGTVSIAAGNGYNGVGGNVTISSGPNSEWSQTLNGFSKILLQGGTAVNTFGLDGGSIAVEGGHNESTVNNPLAAGGNITISGGDALGTYPGGNILLLPGTGTPNGNVGIGTSTPATALQVAGTVTATSFAGNGAGLTNLATPTTANYVFAYSTTRQQVHTANTFQVITNDSSPQMNGWLLNGGTDFICAQTGLYLVQYTAEAYASSSTDMSFLAVDNGNEILGSECVQRALNSTVGGVPDVVSKSFMANFSSGDDLEFQMTGNATAGYVYPGLGSGTVQPSFSCTIIRIQ